MQAFGLRPMDVLRTARRAAEQLQRPGISRQQFARFRFDPRVRASEDKIFIVVAAFRELTGWFITAADLFDVQPLLPQGANGQLPSLSPGGGPLIDGSNACVPVFSGLRKAHRWRPSLQDSPLPGEEAFDALYTQFGVSLRGMAVHRYGIPPDEAEELVHDAFIAFLERHTSIRDVKGWLSGAVRHKCSDYWRSRGREEPLPPEQDEAADPGAERDVRSADVRLTIASAINQLGGRCRDTLHRYYWLDEPLDVIAGCYATTQNNVKQILFTCRRRLRDFINRLSGPHA